jgi:uncharacterized delta-60 repeat protein
VGSAACLRYDPNGFIMGGTGNEQAPPDHRSRTRPAARPVRPALEALEDRCLGTSSKDTATAVAVQGDGKLVVGGYTNSNVNDFAVARLNPDGSLDGTFNGTGKQTLDFGADDWLSALALQPADGKIVLAGTSRTIPAAKVAAARLNADGTLDPSFGSGGMQQVPIGLVSRANALALQPDGRILLAGSASADPASGSVHAVVRLTAAGNLDPSFGSGGRQTFFASGLATNGSASGVAVQADGKILLAGTDTYVSQGPIFITNPRMVAMRLTPDGKLNTSFGNGGRISPQFASPPGGLPPFASRNSVATGVAVDAANQVILVGNTNLTNNGYGPPLTVPTGPFFAYARFLPNGAGPAGAAEVGFGPNTADQANAVALDPAGRAVLVGSTTPAGGAAAFALARLLAPRTGPAMFDPSTATWYLRNEAAAGAPDAGRFAYGAPGWVPVVGPATPTSTASVGVFDPATATWYLNARDSAGPPTTPPFAYGGPDWVPVMGDWTGSGTPTVGVVDPSTMTWYLRNSNGPGAPDIAPFKYGQPGDIPVVGDWNGDGTDTIGVARPNTTTGVLTWYLRNRNSAGAPDITPFAYGAAGWVPVVGDWTGAGVTTVGAFDPVGQFGKPPATWYLKNQNSPGAPDFAPFAYGAANWTPVAGDWNGDGKTTVGVVDPKGTWYLRNTNGPGAPDVAPFAYGAPGWLPLAGAYASPALPLRAAGGPAPAAPGAAELSTGALHEAVQAALGRLAAAGVSPAVLARLASVTAEIRPLPGGLLGEALPRQGLILLEASGAGYGWFVDPTPYQDEEYAGGQALAGTAAAGRMDLLTAVLHELGHIAGLADDDGSPLMADSLPPGGRHLGDLGAKFAAGA